MNILYFDLSMGAAGDMLCASLWSLVDNKKIVLQEIKDLNIPCPDITFENCRIELTKTSKWQCGLYDLRPCLDYGVEAYDNSAFFIRYAKNITIEKTKACWGELCSSYKHAIDAENVENLSLIRFSGKAVSEDICDYKFNNVSIAEE